MNLDSTPIISAGKDNEKLLVITGWNFGFRKVEFTNMLRRELGYSLSSAKDTTDEILANRHVELSVSEANHARVFHLSAELGAKVDGQEHVARRDEN